MPIQKSVLIIDDHPLFREGLRSLINRSEDYRVAGEAGSGEAAVLLASELKPELATMDVSMPGMSGVETTREVMRVSPSTRVLMVSMHPRFEYVAEAFRAGARGYVVKEATGSRLIEALDALARGEYFVDGKVSKEVVGKLLAANEHKNDADDETYNLLTPREQQIMRLVAEGVTARDIAAQLNLSPKTVENHRSNLMKKLDVHNKMELVRYAAKLGLIDVDSWKE